MIFSSAVFAHPVDLESVARSHVVILPSDLLLEVADFRGEEFDRTAAIGAHHVVMAAAIVLVLVAGNAVMKSNFAGQAALRQELQGAVDGGVADMSVFFLNEAMKLVGGEVVAGLKKCPQDGVPLRGLFQAHSLEVAMKDVLGFAHHLAREARLIVDALLQHGVKSSPSVPGPLAALREDRRAPRSGANGG